MKLKQVFFLWLFIIHPAAYAQGEKPLEINIEGKSYNMYPIFFPKETLIDYSGMDFLFFPDSLSDGDWIQFYIGPDSLIARKGTYLKTKKHGDFLNYDLLGNLAQHAEYRQGVLIQKDSFHPNGVLKKSEKYAENGAFLISESWFENEAINIRKSPALYEEWYNNGQKKTNRTYSNQNLDGQISIWFETGGLMYQAEWDEGKQIGKAKYRKKPNGRLKYLMYKKLPKKILSELRGY